MYGVIYKISNLVNDKIYIGQTVRTIEKRFACHIGSALKNEYPDNYFHRAIRKYGAACFKIEQIDEAISKAELNEKEKYWINFYDSFNKGYNATRGGEGGNTYERRTNEQMQTTKQKLSKAQRGKNNGMSVQIKCKNINTNEEFHFDCLADCLKFFNIQSKQTIMSRVRGEDNTVWRDTWIFAYENEDYHKCEIRHYDPSCRKGKKTILKSDMETLSFNSSAKAIEFLKLKNVRLTEGMIINGYTVIFP